MEMIFDSQRDAWLDCFEIDFVNFELEVEAQRLREDEIFLVWEDMMIERFACSDFEASHTFDF